MLEQTAPLACPRLHMQQTVPGNRRVGTLRRLNTGRGHEALSLRRLLLPAQLIPRLTRLASWEPLILGPHLGRTLLWSW